MLKHGSLNVFEAIQNVKLKALLFNDMNAIQCCVLWVLPILRRQFAVHQKKKLEWKIYIRDGTPVNQYYTFDIQYNGTRKIVGLNEREIWRETQSFAVHFPWQLFEQIKCAAMKYRNYDCLNHTLFIKWNMCISHQYQNTKPKSKQRIRIHTNKSPASLNQWNVKQFWRTVRNLYVSLTNWLHSTSKTLKTESKWGFQLKF